jgi:D-alanine-D-alanine ligase
MNKAMTKEVYKKEKLKTPRSKLLESRESSPDIFQSFSLPVIVKPVSAGSSIGITIVTNYKSLPDALDEAFKYSDSVIIEEFISGVEATCGVIDDFRGHEFYALPPVEIRPRKSKFFDYDEKYGGAEEIVPSTFTHEEKKEIERLAIEAHKALGLRHYSRSGFIVTPRRGIYILETNTLPGLTEESLLPKALHAVGASLSHFLDHIVQLAMRGK